MRVCLTDFFNPISQPINNMTTTHTRATVDNSGKTLAKYIKARDKTTLVLTYTHGDGASLRALVASINMKQGTAPSMALFARRSLQVYREHLQRPGAIEAETAALNGMSTRSRKGIPRDAT